MGFISGLLAGAGIALASSSVTAILQHFLTVRADRRRLVIDNQISTLSDITLSFYRFRSAVLDLASTFNRFDELNSEDEAISSESKSLIEEMKQKSSQTTAILETAKSRGTLSSAEKEKFDQAMNEITSMQADVKRNFLQHDQLHAMKSDELKLNREARQVIDEFLSLLDSAYFILPDKLHTQLSELREVAIRVQEHREDSELQVVNEELLELKRKFDNLYEESKSVLHI